MANPAVDAATFLSSQSTSLTIGVNLFIGQVRPVSTFIPAKAVFVRSDAGPAAQRMFGSRKEVRNPQVQVRTRSTSLATGRTLAMTVHDTLQSASVSGYMDAYSMQSEPLFMEEDKNGHYHFSDNFQLQYYST